jgi:hypothetical protein
MKRVPSRKTKIGKSIAVRDYDSVLKNVVSLLEEARRTSARSVNTIMTATYWEVGRRIVDFEQAGEKKAEYGEALLKRLAVDLTSKFGRGFGWRNIFLMRSFYLAYSQILQTLSAISGARIAPSIKPESPEIRQTPSGIFEAPSPQFSLSQLAEIMREIKQTLTTSSPLQCNSR